MRHLKLTLVLLMLLCAVAARSAGETDAIKAKYVFCEAMSQHYAKNDAAFYDLLRHAYSLDSTNTAIGFQLGYCMAMMDNATDSGRLKGIELVKRHAEANPGDIYIVNVYSQLCFRYGDSNEGFNAIERLAAIDTTSSTTLQILAEACMQTKNYEKAHRVFDKIERREGYGANVAIARVNAYFSQNDTANTIAEMRRLLATAPKNANYNMYMSEVHSRLGNADSALFYLNAAQLYEPDNPQVVLKRAQYFFAEGDTAAYNDEIKRAVANKDLDVEDKLSLLTLYSQLHFSDSTYDGRNRELFKMLVLQHPHESDIHRRFASYLYAKDDYKGAREQVLYALDIDPTNAEDWKTLLVIDLLQEDYKQAIATSQRAIEYNPDDIELYQYIAPAYSQMKEYDKALETFDTAIEKVKAHGGDSSEAKKKLSDMLCGKGDVLAARGDTIAAIDFYEQSLAYVPDNAGTLNNYAYCLSLLGKDLDKAESMSSKAVKENPESHIYLDTYAWVYFRQGNYTMALLYIKSAIDHSPKPSAEVLEHYGDILYFNDMKQQAVEQWEKALELEPTSESLTRKVESGEY